MTDFNLSGLSTRSFEQLIQAIAAKVFGPNIIVFGDGPDGGREATFEGSVSYPSKEQTWDGYGVVQAKFLQRPQGSQVDGEWALQQLRDELANLMMLLLAAVLLHRPSAADYPETRLDAVAAGLPVRTRRDECDALGDLVAQVT